MIAGEELPNIKLNALLWQIEDNTNVRVVKYEDDSIVIEGNGQAVYKSLRYCDFEVADLVEDLVEIVKRGGIDAESN